MLNVLSLFDGISCAQIALKTLNIDYTYYASEIDKHAIYITQKNFPDTIQLGDIIMVSASTLPPIDLLIGGSPCQGFSIIGKKLNFEDPRTRLFFEFVRILKEAQQKNPDLVFILENVRMKKEHQNIISQLLGVEPIEINSALVSAQTRKRLYWTNIKGITQPEDKKIMIENILEDSTSIPVIKNRGRIVHKPKKAQCLDASYYKGADNHGQRTGTLDRTTGKWKKLSPVECERLQTLPDNYTADISNSQRYKALGNGFTIEVINHILSFATMALIN